MTIEELKETRDRLGLSQEELANELKVARNTVSRWELGNSKIPEFLDLALETIERKRKLKDKKFARVTFTVSAEENEQEKYRNSIEAFIKSGVIGGVDYKLIDTQTGFWVEITFHFFPDLAYLELYEEAIRKEFGEKVNNWSPLRASEVY